MNSWGYYLSTPADGKTVSLKNNCDPVTGRYKVIDETLVNAEITPKGTPIQSLVGKKVVITSTGYNKNVGFGVESHFIFDNSTSLY